jgi:hypothetical protein
MKNPNLDNMDNHKPRELHGCIVDTFIELHVFVGRFGSFWCLSVSGEVEVDSRGRGALPKSKNALRSRGKERRVSRGTNLRGRKRARIARHVSPSHHRWY